MEYGIVLQGAGLLDLASAMRDIMEAGFKYFEYSHGYVSAMESRGVEAFREAVDLARSLGLVPVQLHGPSLEPGFDLGSPETDRRKRSVERSCRWIQHCSALGVPVMVEHACEFHEDFHATSDLVKSSFRAIARCARDRGIKVAVENEFDPRDMARAGEGRRMTIPARVACLASELLEIVGIDPGALGVCLDFGHANLQRPLFQLEEAVEQLGQHLAATHLHDNEGVSDQHLMPFMGNIRWDRVMQALRSTGFGRPLILEVGGLMPRERATRMNRLHLAKLVLSEICRQEPIPSERSP